MNNKISTLIILLGMAMVVSIATAWTPQWCMKHTYECTTTTTTTSSTTTIYATTTILSSTTIPGTTTISNKNGGFTQSGGIPDANGECLYRSQFGGNDIVEYFYWPTGTIWILYCTTGININTNQSLS